jgi:cytochrome c
LLSAKQIQLELKRSVSVVWIAYPENGAESPVRCYIERKIHKATKANSPFRGGPMRLFALLPATLFLTALPAFAAPIHDAAKKGDVTALASLLEQGADANASNGLATPIYYAVAEGHLAAAQLLLNAGADVNAKSIWGTPLITATGRGRSELTSFLLTEGASHAVTFDSMTPLHLAARTGCLPCVEALVEAGADVNALTRYREQPLHYARINKHYEVASFLISHGTKGPTTAPISSKLSSADPAKGKSTFIKECAGCHFLEVGKRTKLGPNLWGIASRARASFDGFPYSEALRAWKGDWSLEDLNVWLDGPAIAAPGTAMEIDGVTNEQDRIDLIAFLRLQSDNPVPLP